jgi:hypothetical protein
MTGWVRLYDFDHRDRASAFSMIKKGALVDET